MVKSIAGLFEEDDAENTAALLGLRDGCKAALMSLGNALYTVTSELIRSVATRR